MNRDASHIEFTKRSGSLDVVQERTGGERHVLKVRPARGGVAYSHTVDGVLRPWDAESRAILLDAFRRRSHLMEQTAKYRTDPPPPTAGGERWSGIQEITGTSNGIPFRFTVSGKNMSFTGNRVTFIHPGGSLRIDEEVESRSRSAVITGSGADFEIRYSGDWDGASEEERAAWLEHYLRARSGQHGSLFRWKE
jgi:hypothetical protein